MVDVMVNNPLNSKEKVPPGKTTAQAVLTLRRGWGKAVDHRFLDGNRQVSWGKMRCWFSGIYHVYIYIPIYIYTSIYIPIYVFGASDSHGCTWKRFLFQPGSAKKKSSSEAGTHGKTKRRLQLNARQLLVFPVRGGPKAQACAWLSTSTMSWEQQKVSVKREHAWRKVPT